MMIVNLAIAVPETEQITGCVTVRREPSGLISAQWHPADGVPQFEPAALANSLRWLADAVELAALRTT